MQFEGTVTSQLPVSEWHGSLGDATVADAILDRLVHNAHRLELRGDSLRRSQTVAPAAVGNDAKATKRSVGHESEALRSPQRPAAQGARPV